MTDLHLLDTTVLSNFAHVRQPELLQRVFAGSLRTTEVVLAELQVGESLGLVPHCNWNWLPVEALTPRETALYHDLSLTLGAGEASCLALAVVRRGVLVTDDFAARRKAGELTLAVTGTLGVLRLLVKRGYTSTSRANEFLNEMITSGYRSPIDDIRRIVDLED